MTTCEIGAVIRLLRKGRGLTQEQLAVMAHITSSTLGRIERGQENFTFDVLKRIFDALGVPFAFDFR